MIDVRAFKQTAWKLMRHVATDDDLGCLRRLLPAAAMPSQQQVDALLDEVVTSPELLASALSPECGRFYGAMDGMDARARIEVIGGLEGAGRGRAVLLYVTARILKPKVVVETGCFTGWDSAVLLQALQRNGSGQLFSIDLPARDGRTIQRGSSMALPAGMNPGFMVPDSFRERWTLIEGDTRRELMPLIEREGPVGLFLHDSDHSYPHMMWEYTAILPHMAQGGIIASDDIAWNTAFWDFASAIGQRPVIHRGNANVGAVRIGGEEAW